MLLFLFLVIYLLIRTQLHLIFDSILIKKRLQYVLYTPNKYKITQFFVNFLYVSSFKEGANKLELPLFHCIQLKVDFPEAEQPDSSGVILILGKEVFVSGQEVNFLVLWAFDSPGLRVKLDLRMLLNEFFPDVFINSVILELAADVLFLVHDGVDGELVEFGLC
jgi:hypothetical protein